MKSGHSFASSRPISKPGIDRTKIGDQWTFVAIDAETKVVPSYRVGKRTRANAIAFMTDLSGRLSNRVQISTDALNSYVDAIEQAFGADVDYGQAIKIYDGEIVGAGRYAPPRIVSQQKIVVAGNPDLKHISTSFVERQNLTMRMSMRRFTRLTNAFSKKLENHEHAIALHYMFYNFCRIHQTLRVTPAMQCGLAKRVWEIEDLVALLD